MIPSRVLGLAIAAVLSCVACAGLGTYVWVNELGPEETGTSDYVIATGDVLSIRVYGQEAMATKAKVRTDGKISMPLIGDVTVLAMPPITVARQIEAALKNFVNSPNVTVSVEEFAPTAVSVIGEVGHPGPFSLDRNASILQALAAAGGLTENASRDAIFVLRDKPVARRIRFTYESLTHAPPQSPFHLRPGDVVVVE